ncbi:IS1595 family transposase [Bradyrhizobium sp. 2S1]|uniref:IS1595 family transposase n=1 Tax=Bradyrhizobium sp. 2S1 TaxID=1404429 RepID=UPI001408D65B|nr:IS1595 family transposase [Bradyrhizobium sp. 2S1]MCK7665277.1 IS1595 family transposase [Bradyrhizobium sp. 2S1]
MSLLKIYTDENAAREHLEALNWPDGPICPHCGVVNEATKLTGKSTRPGVYKCRPCQKPFSVTVGTVFERSKIKLNVWVHAVDLYTASKKGFSAHQLHRTLGMTYKTAWFMAHRIREAMTEVKGPTNPMGGEGKIVEADETYYGKKADKPKTTARGTPFLKGGMGAHKIGIVSLVERGGKVRSFHIQGNTTADTVTKILRTNVRRDSTLHTDESKLYTKVGEEFAKHDTVNHGKKEYVRYTGIVSFPEGEPYTITTNTIEGFFSIFKRGMKGIYQHCGEQHLHRYLAEFDFRYNNRVALGYNDSMRAENALKGIVGKRLMYRRPDEAKVS